MKPILAHIIIAGLLAFTASGCNRPPEPERINIARVLSSTEPAGCFDTAKSSIDIELPKDAGPHDAFKTEWWYYTGNLETSRARHFGYQLTFFRQALSCEPVGGTSKWRTRQLYFAHFAITDTRNNAFYSNFRMNRQSLDIAGATSLPFQVWIDDWHVTQAGTNLTLAAKGDTMKLQLTLTAEKQVVFQGNNGLSRKGKKPFNASYYYSIPRLETHGTVSIGTDKYQVKGKTWFDHEWSTSALGDDIAGWDWFSAHLDDGRDLMICQIRQADGAPNGYGFGSLSRSNGTYEILSEAQFSIRALRQWKSPTTGNQYPSLWDIKLPDHGINLRVTPVIQDQEHTHMMAYWEGAARFKGKGINGLGYVELTGYQGR
ncbi:putative ABC-type transport system, hydrolase component [Desulforapulum autotrophicum HRM2]|uniref:ABC-type transport system, hydrolase component n=1 Tax=Desulforapulum autotrophicum (strain ATCC 43914 / DSM 3382 / VKM B-1955 / HRM2) TaxID=177437 RepID=C0QDT3_DESAH|nr:lipocalin-like domain-containing protein [Desulforapulum autotrophicum]ACN17354.1 putative ABC-type transport system, hydrolase component [Desulforapulum autotrophicum HRM2]